MLKIVKNSETLVTVNKPVYVYLQENGSFALSTEGEAQGVVVDGTVYHIAGRPTLEGHEDVILEEINETDYQLGQKAAQEANQLQNETAMAELSILVATLLGGGIE